MTTWSMYITGTTCGGISTLPTGTIKSIDKNFDGVYDHDLHCVWIIAAPPGITISFTFIQFQLYGECGDYVLVRAFFFC